MQTADIVIVGAGVTGASIAWHLARQGCTNVVVIDQAARSGEGSTGRAIGGFRAQFDSEIGVRLSKAFVEFERRPLAAASRACGRPIPARPGTRDPRRPTAPLLCTPSSRRVTWSCSAPSPPR